MTRVLFLIDTLRGGGAERVLVNLVNNMDLQKYDITVETLFDGGVNEKRLASHIKYFCRKAPYPRGIGYFFSLFTGRQLYRYFIKNDNYDVMIAYMHGASVKILSGCRNTSIKRIAWLHTGNPETSSFFSFWFNKKRGFQAYADCDAIVGVSKSVVEAFSAYTGITEKLHVIYNTNEADKIRKMALQNTEYCKKADSIRICSVGRIVTEKGFDRLVNTVTRLHEEGYPVELVIVGGGVGLKELDTRIEKNNASSYIQLTGEQSNPYPIVYNSDFFVCSSVQEGLSTAVTEAIILGKPVISTDVSGAKEILGDHDEYGLVVENSEEGIYAGIKRFLEEPALLDHYAQMAQKRAAFFSTEHTVKQAEDLIDEVIKN